MLAIMQLIPTEDKMAYKFTYSGGGDQHMEKNLDIML